MRNLTLVFFLISINFELEKVILCATDVMKKFHTLEYIIYTTKMEKRWENELA